MARASANTFVLSVHIDAKETSAYYKQIKNNVLPSALAQAVTSVARRGRQGAMRMVASETNISTRKIGKRMYLARAKPKRPTAFFHFYLRPFTWTFLGARSASKKKGGVRSQVGVEPQGWIADSPQGHNLAWKRQGSKRYPIKVLAVHMRPYEDRVVRIFGKVVKRHWRTTLNKVLFRRLRKKGLSVTDIGDAIRFNKDEFN